MNEQLSAAIGRINPNPTPAMLRASLSVYVGDWGTYVVPPDVLEKAIAMNNGKSINDRRTKGARHLSWWGRCKDGEQETIELLKKHASK